jgi:large subunit ribosomal protein L22
MASREKKKADARKEARTSGPATAEHRGLRMSARKARVIADTIRGKSVDEAATNLVFQRRRAAEPIRKVLDSAVANADSRNMDIDRLYVADVQINKGTIMRRFMPRAHGRATRIRKQTCHIRIALAERE